MDFLPLLKSITILHSNSPLIPKGTDVWSGRCLFNKSETGPFRVDFLSHRSRGQHRAIRPPWSR